MDGGGSGGGCSEAADSGEASGEAAGDSGDAAVVLARNRKAEPPADDSGDAAVVLAPNWKAKPPAEGAVEEGEASPSSLLSSSAVSALLSATGTGG